VGAGSDCARNSRSQREGNRQAVGHPDNHIANGFRRGEMVFRMWRSRHSIVSKEKIESTAGTEKQIACQGGKV
jgi:hypothetical protein